MAEGLGCEVEVSFYGETGWPSYTLKLREAEVSKLRFEPIDEAEEKILSIELNGVPSPVRSRGEELNAHKRVLLVLLAVSRGKSLANVIRQKFHGGSVDGMAGLHPAGSSFGIGGGTAFLLKLEDSRVGEVCGFGESEQVIPSEAEA